MMKIRTLLEFDKTIYEILSKSKSPLLSHNSITHILRDERVLELAKFYTNSFLYSNVKLYDFIEHLRKTRSLLLYSSRCGNRKYARLDKWGYKGKLSKELTLMEFIHQVEIHSFKEKLKIKSVDSIDDIFQSIKDQSRTVKRVDVFDCNVSLVENNLSKHEEIKKFNKIKGMNTYFGNAIIRVTSEKNADKISYEQIDNNVHYVGFGARENSCEHCGIYEIDTMITDELKKLYGDDYISKSFDRKIECVYSYKISKYDDYYDGIQYENEYDMFEIKILEVKQLPPQLGFTMKMIKGRNNANVE